MLFRSKRNRKKTTLLRWSQRRTSRKQKLSKIKNVIGSGEREVRGGFDKREEGGGENSKGNRKSGFCSESFRLDNHIHKLSLKEDCG